MEPHTCPHDRTTIERDGAVKVETCVRCDEPIATFDVEKSSFVCGSTDTNDGTPCENYPVSGSDRCRMHGGHSDGGEREDSGAPEKNTNAVSHGLYAECNYYYREEMTDTQRALCDQIFQDYCTAYRERNGEPHTGDQTQLFEVAVNHIKVIDADNWLVDKPDELDSTHPLVDKEEKFNTEGVPYQEYKPGTLLTAQQKLSNHNRRWLKDKNLLHDPDSKQAEEVGNLISQLKNPDGSE